MASRRARRGSGRASRRYQGSGPVAPSTDEPITGWWTANMDGVPLGDMGSNSNVSAGQLTPAGAGAKAIWGYWDQAGASVVNIASESLPPAPWGGTKAIKWFKPYGSDQYYQKLTKRFTADSWPDGAYVSGNRTQGLSTSPADVSARYIMWRYIRMSEVLLDPDHCWLTICTFKEEFIDNVGSWNQEGTGWKVIFDNYGQNYIAGQMTAKKRFRLDAYTDRWVKWEYRVYQGATDDSGHGGRIELWADGALVDTGYEGDVVQDTRRNSSGHVGSAAFSTLANTLNWCYPIGQYTSNQTTNGQPDYINTQCTSYVGLAYILPLSTLGGTVTTLASETWAGTNGTAWPSQWTTQTNSGTIDIQTNQGRMITPAGAVPGPSALLSGMTAVADSDATVTLIGPSAPGLFGYLSARADSFQANQEVSFNGYQLVVHVNGFIWLQKTVAGLATGLTTHDTVSFIGPGTLVKMRLQVQGTSIRAKVWDGAGAEPGSWMLTATDSSLANGKAGLSSLGSSNTALWDDLTVTTV